MNFRFFRFTLAVLLAFMAVAQAQNTLPLPVNTNEKPADKSVHPNEFKNLSYLKIGDADLTLDVYQNPASGPAPVLVYFHGGGWWKGERPASYASFRSFLAMGFSVVNVDYRLTPVAPAPAAVQDARCALSWIKQNAKKYNFDATRVVTYGTSAGGHLALMSGMLPDSTDIDLAQCKELPRVVAILDFYGPADVVDITGGAENRRGWATRWITNTPNPAEMAKRMSPMTYIRSGLPAVFIVHGDSDPTVPYPQSVRLQKALDEAGVPNKLYTVAGGVHGKFDPDQKKAIQSSIKEFLSQQKVLR